VTSHAYFFLKTVAVFVVMVAADAADWSFEEQRRMIDQMLCILKRTSSLLTRVVASKFLLHCNPCFARLQPLKLAGYSDAPT
jgi:hypothetical protein